MSRIPADLAENGRLTLRQMLPTIPQEKIDRARIEVAAHAKGVEDYRALVTMLGMDPQRGGGMDPQSSGRGRQR